MTETDALSVIGVLLLVATYACGIALLVLDVTY